MPVFNNFGEKVEINPICFVFRRLCFCIVEFPHRTASTQSAFNERWTRAGVLLPPARAFSIVELSNHLEMSDIDLEL